jgi:hypothetical protein
VFVEVPSAGTRSASPTRRRRPGSASPCQAITISTPRSRRSDARLLLAQALPKRAAPRTWLPLRTEAVAQTPARVDLLWPAHGGRTRREEPGRENHATTYVSRPASPESCPLSPSHRGWLCAPHNHPDLRDSLDDTQERRELRGRLPNARDDAEAVPCGTSFDAAGVLLALQAPVGGPWIERQVIEPEGAQGFGDRVAVEALGARAVEGGRRPVGSDACREAVKPASWGSPGATSAKGSPRA